MLRTKNLLLLIFLNCLALNLFSMEESEAKNPLVILNKTNYNLEIDFNKLASVKGRFFDKVNFEIKPYEKKMLTYDGKDVAVTDIFSGEVTLLVLSKSLIIKKISKKSLNDFARNNPNKQITINVESGWRFWSSSEIFITFSATEVAEEGWIKIKKPENLEEEGLMDLPQEKELVKEGLRNLPKEKNLVKFPQLDGELASYDKAYLENILRTLEIDLELVQVWYPGGYIAFKLNKESGSFYIEGQDLRHIEKNIVNAQKSRDVETLKKIAGNYKIHLMPKPHKVIEVFRTLSSAINKDAEFSLLIDYFKILNYEKFKEQISDLKLEKLADENIFPEIVIYPSNGKENAQKALDKIIELFGQSEGINITPRFNQKVTSLIYFAQGNGDCKKDQDFKKYFEINMIYYERNFTGIEEDYHLKF